MTATDTTLDLTLSTLTKAIETRDAAAMTSVYADDAELLVMDKIHQPSKPLVLRGKDAIAAYLKDICSREMTHRVERSVAANDTIAYSEACQYPDGTRVQCITVLELRGGKVTRQVGVQTWDE
ncbi:MAG: hypothetical protein QOF51_1605 [Chloroflexota bacterium]|nr:hypothetical protein [Chloroflexota bacterium]